MVINQTGAAITDNSVWSGVEPTATQYSIGSAPGANTSGGSYVDYLFAEKAGHSKFGSWSSIGAAGATPLYTPIITGLREINALLFKRVDLSSNWFLVYRDGDQYYAIYPNLDAARTAWTAWSIVDGTFTPGSGWEGTYIYAAI